MITLRQLFQTNSNAEITPYFSLILIHEGILNISVDGVDYKLRKNDFGYIPRGSLLSMTKASEGFSFYIIDFDLKEIEKELQPILKFPSTFLRIMDVNVIEDINSKFSCFYLCRRYEKKFIINHIMEMVMDNSMDSIKETSSDSLITSTIKHQTENGFQVSEPSPSVFLKKMNMTQKEYQTKKKCLLALEKTELGCGAKEACKQINLAYSTYYRNIVNTYKTNPQKIDWKKSYEN